MSDALPLKYRPKTFSEMIGNESAIESIKNIMQRELKDIPSAWLLCGGSGCGKTTIARIMKTELECDDVAYFEFNSSNSRGIDTIRQIQENAYLSPMIGKTKVYLLDECFHKNTSITTDKGDVPIKDIKIGDKVENIYGWDTVEDTKINKVSLERLCKVNFANGKYTYTTTDHKYFTSGGWVQAKELDSCDCLCYVSNRVRNTQLLMEGNLHDTKRQNVQSYLCYLSEIISRKGKQSKVLSRVHDFNMHVLWKGIYSKGKEQIILFTKLFGKGQNDSSRDTGSSLQQRISEERGIETTRDSYAHRERRGDTQTTQQKDERKQSLFRPFDQSKDDRIQTNERNFGWLEEQSWRKWERTFTAPTTIIQSVREWLEHGTHCQYLPAYSFGEGQMVQGEQVSSSLQDRHSSPYIEDSDRSGRQFPFIQDKTTGRCEEGKSVEGIRVESVEIYQRGSNDKSFESIVSDTERDQGYIEMYDLTITNHPSYKADGVIVHNCHNFTKDAMNAALKMLEDAPKNVYFILATTNPEKLIKPILSRCTTIQLAKCPPKKIEKLLEKVSKAEGVDIPTSVMKRISEASDGTPRDALKMLDMIIDMTDEKQMIDAIESIVPDESNLYDFCKMLINPKATWKEIAEVIKNTETEPEAMRRGILNLLGSFVLKNGDVHIAQVMELFERNYYDSGKAGLILSCLATRNIE